MRRINLEQMPAPKELAESIVRVVKDTKPPYEVELRFPKDYARDFIQRFNSAYSPNREILLSIVRREVLKSGYEIFTSSINEGGETIKLQLIKLAKT